MNGRKKTDELTVPNISSAFGPSPKDNTGPEDPSVDAAQSLGGF